MAEALWARHLAYYDEDETSFFNYAKYHVTNPKRDDVEAEGGDWVGLMNSITWKK